MSETVHAGLIGGLLSKTAGAPGTDGEGRGGAAGNGGDEDAAGFFAAVFDTAAAPAKRSTPEPAGLFIHEQPTAELRNPALPAFDGAQEEVLGAHSTRGTSLPDFRQGDYFVRHREILFHRNEAGAAQQDINLPAIPVNGLQRGLSTAAESGASANRYDREFAFATIKVRSGGADALQATQNAATFRPEQIAPPLSTIKGDNAPNDIVRDTANSAPSGTKIQTRTGETNSLLSAAAPQSINLRPGEVLSGLTPVFEELADFAPISERRLKEFASIETVLSGHSLPQKAPGGAPQFVTTSLFGHVGGLTVSNNVDPGFRSDGEHPFDPVFTAPASLRTANSAAFAVAPTSPNFAAMAGVLPQIQAAIVSRAGGETIEVRLDPPDLGRVRIDFNVENGETVRAVVAADRSETLDHLKRNIADLEHQLRQSGFASISFEFSSDSRQFGAEADGPGAMDPDIGDASVAMDHQNTIYLNLRENAQLDLLL